MKHIQGNGHADTEKQEFNPDIEITKEMIEAALLGAEDTDNKPKKKRVAGGFAVSKYDVVVMNSPNEFDVPQLLEGSLKDLLKDEPPPKRRTRRNPSGESQY